MQMSLSQKIGTNFMLKLVRMPVIFLNFFVISYIYPAHSRRCKHLSSSWAFSRDVTRSILRRVVSSQVVW